MLCSFTVFLIKQWSILNHHHSSFGGCKFTTPSLLIRVLALSTFKVQLFFLSSKWFHNSFPVGMSDLIFSHTLSHSPFFSPNGSFVFIAYSSLYLLSCHPLRLERPTNPPNICPEITFEKVTLVSGAYLRSPIHPPFLFMDSIHQTQLMEARIWNIFITLLWGSPYSSHQRECESWQTLQFTWRIFKDIFITKGNV